METNNNISLIDGKARLDLALNAAHMGVWKFDLTTNLRIFDNQTCELLGLDQSNFTGSAEEFYNIVHPEDKEKLKLALARTINQGVPYEPEFRIIWSDMSVHDITSRGELVRDNNDQASFIHGVVWDVTENKKMEKALTNAELRYRILFDQSPDGVVIVNPDTADFVEFNEMACSQLGYSRDEFARLNISDIDIVETSDDIKQRIQKVISNGRNDFETLHRTKQGKIKNIHVTAQNIEILGSQVYYCTWRDITEQKNDQAAIENYMHILTHDLRSPMGPILGFSDLLKEDGYSPEEVKNFAGIINDSGRKMLALMEGYLLLKKIECGQTVLSKKPKTIFEIIEEIKKIFVGLKSNGCNLRVIPASLLLGSIDFGFFQKMLSMDDVLFNSLITNLLNNAIEEATRRDKLINVDIHKEDDHIMLSFTNSGEIPHDIQSRLFQKFVSGKSSGTGIGLYSAKLIAEAHDWELIYRPLPGKTSFVIKIPDGPKL